MSKHSVEDLHKAENIANALVNVFDPGVVVSEITDEETFLGMVMARATTISETPGGSNELLNLGAAICYGFMWGYHLAAQAREFTAAHHVGG